MKRTQLDKQIGGLFRSHGPLRLDDEFSDRVMGQLELTQVARPPEIIVPLTASEAFTDGIMDRLAHPATEIAAPPILSRRFLLIVGALALSLVIIGLSEAQPETFQDQQWLDTQKILDFSLRQWSLTVGCLTGGALVIADYLVRMKSLRLKF